MNNLDAEICIVEPFFGGSHKQLIDLLQSGLVESNLKYDLYTLPSKKWHWRASENQLVYPIRNNSTRNKNQIENKDQRDFQYGYNQILTSLVADKVVFNSNYNRTTFLENINAYLKLIPDNRHKINVKQDLEPKCSVLYFPINLDENLLNSIIAETTLNNLLDFSNHDDYLNRPLSILWSNRWEHDKNPEEFFSVLFKLHDLGVDFRLHVIGEQFSEIPEIFSIAKEKLKNKIDSWGYMPSKFEYYQVLSRSDIVLSTSIHEFFGVAIIEACMFGAYPIVPNRLVYPELYAKECCYSTGAQLIKKLKYMCSKPRQFRLSKHDIFTSNQRNNNNNNNNKNNRKMNSTGSLSIDNACFNSFQWTSLKNEFISLFHF